MITASIATTTVQAFLPRLPQNTGLTFLRDPSGGSYGPGKENLISSIVNRMLSDACTKIFQQAGLTPPSELLKKGVVIGPASLLLDSSKENLAYLGHYGIRT